MASVGQIQTGLSKDGLLCSMMSGAFQEDLKAGGWSHQEKARWSPRSGSWCSLLAGDVAGAVGRTPPHKVAGQASREWESQAEVVLAFYVLTLGVTQRHSFTFSCSRLVQSSAQFQEEETDPSISEWRKVSVT